MTACYRIYGQTLASDFPFKTPLLVGSGSPDISFVQVFTAPDDQDWRTLQPVFQNPNMRLYHCPAYDVFQFMELADFYVFPENVVCHQYDPDYDYQIEIIFLGLMFAYWLEKRGIPALHASAVNLNGEGIAFLSANFGGKSALAATLIQMGYPLLTDDILPVQQKDSDYRCHPGFPQMRMWPEVAQHFVGSYEGLELAHPRYDKRRVPVSRLGEFYSETVHLGRIYVPQRHSELDEQIRFERIPPVQAMMELTGHSFAVHVVKSAQLQAQRFAFFGGMVQSVPVYKLSYPDGLQHLPAVCQKIVEWQSI